MRNEPPYSSLPDEYDQWMALYFRNRLTSAYARTAGDAPPDDMAELLHRADQRHPPVD